MKKDFEIVPVSLSKDGFLSVSYNHLVAAVIEAVKEFYHRWINDSSVIHRKLASVEIENAQIKARSLKIEMENIRIKNK